ncbi:tryptophan-rich sensory protein [Akkermansiaceae bacterium]|nr:tryptophan-rich sensory protein [Akkermansiaceae bacterium]
MGNNLSKGKQALALAGFVIVTFIAPLAAVWAPPGAWHAALAKPDWNPPGWIFGPVWTALYLLMAVAAWLVWRREGWRLALSLYAVQLALNAAWSPVFFGAKEIGWALAVILLLWCAVLATALAFARVNRASAWMFAPYLAWVSFAAFLNFTLWRMNG